MKPPPPPSAWKERAACRPTEDRPIVQLMVLFFPEDEWDDDVVEAKAICATCPVQEECLDFAMGLREKNGVWGGYTTAERRNIMRKRRKAGIPIPRYSLPMPKFSNDE